MPVRHYDWIAHFGRRTPDKIAVVDLASQRRLSYALFDARLEQTVFTRVALGISKPRRPSWQR